MEAVSLDENMRRTTHGIKHQSQAFYCFDVLYSFDKFYSSTSTVIICSAMQVLHFVMPPKLLYFEILKFKSTNNCVIVDKPSKQYIIN